MSRPLRVAGSEILVGPLEAGLERLADHAGPLPVVTDATVWSLHGDRLRDRLPVEPLFVPEGEAAKSWGVLEGLLHALARLNPSRDTPLVAFGGGSVGDVGGLAASLFKRGLPLVAIPTTLLAQADSAVGGKTAIDFAGTKNLVGSFAPPRLVLAEPALISTLSDRDLKAGYAEVVKYGLIDDPAFYTWCEDEAAAMLSGHLPALEEAIARCVIAKGRAVEGDLDDRTGQRALLNLGHSFAHAIEAEAGLGRLRHGEAVSIGLVLAHRLSSVLGLCPAADANRVEAHLDSVGLPTRLEAAGVRGARLLGPMTRDKKNAPGQYSLVLTRGIGRAFFDPAVPVEAIAAVLDEG